MGQPGNTKNLASGEKFFWPSASNSQLQTFYRSQTPNFLSVANSKLYPQQAHKFSAHNSTICKSSAHKSREVHSCLPIPLSTSQSPNISSLPVSPQYVKVRPCLSIPQSLPIPRSTSQPLNPAKSPNTLKYVPASQSLQRHHRHLILCSLPVLPNYL